MKSGEGSEKMALIYIVEDDQNIREIESFALKNSGYQVQGFECAKDFYHQLAEKTPDCILLDIMLPDEDGLEIVRKLRAIPDTKKVPVMMVTAKTTEIEQLVSQPQECRWAATAEAITPSSSTIRILYIPSPPVCSLNMPGPPPGKRPVRRLHRHALPGPMNSIA